MTTTEIPTLPFRGYMGHLKEIQRDPLELFLRAQALSDMVHLKIAYMRPVLLFHPELIHHVLVTNPDNYLKQTRGYDHMRFVLGHSVLTSDGEFWKHQRRIMQPAFHRRRIATLSHTMSAAALQLVERLREHPAGTPLDAAEMTMGVTLQIAGETMFGTDTSDVNTIVLESLTELQKGFKRNTYSAIPLAEWVPTPANIRYHQARRSMNQVVFSIIHQRRQQPTPSPDLLGLLMEPSEEGEPMSDQQLRNEVLTMLLAGHETVASLVIWALYQLSLHPESQRRLEAELETVLSGRTPDMSDLSELIYTRQVLHETLRLFPPAWAIGRVPQEDDEIGGAAIPRGRVVYMSPYVTHRHPEFWDRPHVYDPDRWETDPLAGKHNLAFFPFGGGRRKCIGDRVAMLEATILLTTLCQHYRFTPAEGFEVEVEAMVTLRPKSGLMMNITPRSG